MVSTSSFENNGIYDYRPDDFYLAVTESDSSLENWNPGILQYEWKENIEFTKRYDKREITVYCNKCDFDFSQHDQYKVNAYDLPPLVVCPKRRWIPYM